jgi:ubiquinone/menaquinone biosynthesis C-methylase UbiE
MRALWGLEIPRLRFSKVTTVQTSKHWQLDLEAAKRYQEIPVPTILGPAAHALVDKVKLDCGIVVLDVGCGTGAATRYTANFVGPDGRIAGVDINAGMIEVAKSLSENTGAPIDWYENSAFKLPFEENTFDVALSAQTIQFLDNRVAALEEMRRVLKPRGQLAISVWCEVRQNPYFDALMQAVTNHLGAETASGLGAAFTLSEPSKIEKLLVEAGLQRIEVEMCELSLKMPELGKFVANHISATPMSAKFFALPESLQNDLVEEVADNLAMYQTEAGATVPFRIQVAKAQK